MNQLFYCRFMFNRFNNIHMSLSFPSYRMLILIQCMSMNFIHIENANDAAQQEENDSGLPSDFQILLIKAKQRVPFFYIYRKQIFMLIPTTRQTRHGAHSSDLTVPFLKIYSLPKKKKKSAWCLSKHFILRSTTLLYVDKCIDQCR